MSALDRKMLRDLWRLRGQALAIALVIASGVATLVMSLSTLDSLRSTQHAYYTEQRFADVFASLKRAPERLRLRLEAIPGVEKVETRVIAAINVDVPDYPDPVTGLLVSIPDSGPPLINALYLRQGRLVEPGRDDEVIISDAFAEAHGMVPGDRLAVVINGRRKRLTVVGVALSPEHILQVKPDSFIPDFERYGIFWMGRTPLATAYDMDGAFNDAVLTLSANAREADVLERVDLLLEPYGGFGAYGRTDQLSHRYLSEEFKQLERMATMFPVIFLSVAAFLLNVVVGRLVSTQREEIAIIKAFGYTDRAIGWHYVKLIALIAAIGLAVGVVGGARFGQGISNMYMKFYRFPFLNYELEPHVVVWAALVCAGAALSGAMFAVRAAVRLAPAEAMRPMPPARYRETWIERLGFKRFLSQSGRMILRNLGRRPLKALLSVTGIAFSCGIVMMGSFGDAFELLIDVHFGIAQREDLTVTFVEPTSSRALADLRGLPGVQYAQPFRAVPVRLRAGHRTYRTAIQGISPGGDLQRVLTAAYAPVALPPGGIVLTDYLADLLRVAPGDRLVVEVLEGPRPVRDVVVAGLVSQFIGVSAYMDLAALNRFMHEGHAISGAYLAVDSRLQPEIYETLKEAPRVSGLEARLNAMRNFRETMAEQVLTFAFFNTILATTIAFGVVYNTMRIALSERGRELASMRVLGLTRGEISFILLGELGALTLAAIPFGFVIGHGLTTYVMRSLATDLFRIPAVVEPRTYAFAATVVLASACVSGLIVRRRINHLDLVAVLKTRE